MKQDMCRSEMKNQHAKQTLPLLIPQAVDLPDLLSSAAPFALTLGSGALQLADMTLNTERRPSAHSLRAHVHQGAHAYIPGRRERRAEPGRSCSEGYKAPTTNHPCHRLQSAWVNGHGR
jgi:hypothetical protein